MNFSTFWPNNSKQPNKKKRFRPKSKFKSSVFITQGTQEERSLNSMEEIRRQAVNISSSGLGTSTISLASAPIKDKKGRTKSVSQRSKKN